MLTKVPRPIKDHISNAKYYLKAARKFPSGTFNGIRIFLLLTAWENIQIAEEELHAWVWKTAPMKKLYKSHAYKFRNVRKSKSIERIILGPPGTPAQTISYSKDIDFEHLLQICRYGPKTGSRELESIFKTGWFPDDFERFVESRIGWEEMMVKIYEKLPKTRKV